MARAVIDTKKKTFAPIESYAVIGDCETAALVGLDGSIDWLCWPEFSSDACFARLLGSEENGRWLLAPAAEAGAHFGLASEPDKDAGKWSPKIPVQSPDSLVPKPDNAGIIPALIK